LDSPKQEQALGTQTNSLSPSSSSLVSRCRATTSSELSLTCVAALVRVAEPIALTSIFPYAIKLVAHYGASESQAPFFAGILISAFSLAEACTGMYWGGLSDRIGRKPVRYLQSHNG
jgi:MFS family permease